MAPLSRRNFCQSGRWRRQPETSVSSFKSKLIDTGAGRSTSRQKNAHKT